MFSWFFWFPVVRYQWLASSYWSHVGSWSHTKSLFTAHIILSMVSPPPPQSVVCAQRKITFSLPASRTSLGKGGGAGGGPSLLLFLCVLNDGDVFTLWADPGGLKMSEGTRDKGQGTQSMSIAAAGACEITSTPSLRGNVLYLISKDNITGNTSTASRLSKENKETWDSWEKKPVW